MRPALRIVAGLTLFQLGTTTVAWAYSCDGPPIADEVIASGNTIVVGTILSIRPPGAGCSREPIEFTTVLVHVTEVIAGDATLGPLEVRMGLHLDLEEGARWVLEVYGEQFIGVFDADVLAHLVDVEESITLRHTFTGVVHTEGGETLGTVAGVDRKERTVVGGDDAMELFVRALEVQPWSVGA